jgi:hypothetical protein
MNTKPILAIFLSLSTAFTLLSSAPAQIAPAGLAVIQNPAGVYYVFYADSVQQYRSRFYYLNYGTKQFDVIDTTISSNGSFSGTSGSTGRTVTGQVSSTTVSLNYNGVARSGPKESLYGPTQNLAGQWRGWVSDPNIGVGYGEFIRQATANAWSFTFRIFSTTLASGVSTRMDLGAYRSCQE